MSSYVWWIGNSWKSKEKKKYLKWAKQRISSSFQSKDTKARFDALKFKDVTANQVEHMIEMSGLVFWKNWEKTEAIWSNFKFFNDELHLHTWCADWSPGGEFCLQLTGENDNH